MKVLLARDTQCGSNSIPSKRKEGANEKRQGSLAWHARRQAGGSGDRPDPGKGQAAGEETAAPCGVDLLHVQIPNHQKPS
jgi:hypothetical protein